MHSSTSNLLYRHPELYERLYPDLDEATPKMCRRLFQLYLPHPPTSILDIGCGTARDLNVLSRDGAECWGVDFIPENIQYAQSLRPHLKLSVGDMRSVRLKSTFEAILCMGSALMYALEKEDITATLQTFQQHARAGTLLILDLNNASAFFPGGTSKMQREFEVHSPGFKAKAITKYSFDRSAQHLIRQRTWRIPGQDTVEDFCRYRMFFPAELKYWLSMYQFETLGIWDNKELKESELTQSTLYVAAQFKPDLTESVKHRNRSKSHRTPHGSTRSS